MDNETTTTRLDCPYCKKEMAVHHSGTTHDTKRGVQYRKDVFWCEADDVWLSLETPIGQ